MAVDRPDSEPDDRRDDEAAVEELLRSLEQELKESGTFPLDEAGEAGDGGADASDLDPDGGNFDEADSGEPGPVDIDSDQLDPEAILGGAEDVDPREMFSELSDLFGKLAEGSDELSKIFDSYEPALQLAIKVATQDEPEPNVEPVSRIRLQEIFKLAQRHVQQSAELSLTAPERNLEVVTRREWVTAMLQVIWPLLTEARSKPASDTGADPADELNLANPLGFVQNVLSRLSSTARSMQMAGLLGELSHVVFGNYTLPVAAEPAAKPKPPRPQTIIARNVESFAEEWDLDFDQAALWVCLTEIVSDAIMSQPAVSQTLWQLYRNYLAEVEELMSEEWEEKFQEFEGSFMSEPAELLQSLFGDSGEVAIQFPESAEQIGLAQDISAIASAAAGHVLYVSEILSRELMGNQGNLIEAFRRHQVKTADAATFARQNLGTYLDLDGGLDFITELAAQGGRAALEKLWSSEASLPTHAELSAPRLWLARMDLLPDGDLPSSD